MKKIFSLLSGLFMVINLSMAQPGAIDPNFNNALNATGANGDVRSTSLQIDGKIIIGGVFTSYNGIERIAVARLNTDGSLDLSFNAGTLFSNLSSDVVSAIQPDGKIIIGCSAPNPQTSLVRLNTDGSVDNSFNDDVTGFTSVGIHGIVLQTDGKMIIFGDRYDGNINRRLYRLNPDGSIDNSFSISSVDWQLSDGFVRVVLQTDGKILACGHFTNSSSNTVSHVIRLNTDGSADNSFSDAGIDIAPTDIALQADGKMIVSSFSTSNSIVRLNTDGSMDASFNPDLNYSDGFGFGPVLACAIQNDGKIILSAAYFYLGEIDGLYRLNTDGSIDESFQTGQGFNDGSNGIGTTILIQPDGKIITAGFFYSYDHIPLRGIVRVTNEPCSNFVTPSLNISVSPTGSTCQGSGVSVEFTTNVVNGGYRPLYQWQNNGVDIPDQVFPTYQSSLFSPGDVISCKMISNARCTTTNAATSNSIAVNVIPPAAASVSILLTSGSIPVCTGNALTFTATPVNGGSTPVYQWVINRAGNNINIGSNSPVLTYSDFNNADILSCKMLSNALCVFPVNSVSSSIVVNVATMSTWYLDVDEDGYYTGSPVTSCTSPGIGYSTTTPLGSDDCNDNDANITAGTTWYLDADGDGFYTGSPVVSCTYPGAGYITNPFGGGDCDDALQAVHPGAIEIQGNGIDDNCNGEIDELPYCVPSVSNPCGFSRIVNVQLGSIANNSAGNFPCANNGYQNYTAQSTSHLAGSQVDFSIECSSFQNQWVNIYVDYNNNFSFNDPGEEVATHLSVVNNSLATGSFIIPSSQPGGSYRLRIVSDLEGGPLSPCHSDWGEVEDYTLNVTSAGFCTPVVDEPCIHTSIADVQVGNMVNNSTCNTGYDDYSATHFTVSRPGDLINYNIHTSVGGFAQGVAMYIDYNNDGDFDDANETIFENVYSDGFSNAIGSFQVSALQTAGNYRMRLISTDFNDFSNPCHSTTGEAEDYTLLVISGACVPVVANPCSGSSIRSVSIGGFLGDASQTCNGYTDYTLLSNPVGVNTYTKVRPGQILQYIIETNNGNAQDVNIYVDFNNNGDFNDPGERVVMNASMAQYSPAIGTFGVPSNQPYGTYRLRVTSSVNNTFADPCFVENGEIEDYNLIVAPCMPFAGTLGVWGESSTDICLGQTTMLDMTVLNATEPLYIFSYTDGTDNYGYVSGANIGQDMHVPITLYPYPITTTTYSMVSLQDVFGCPGTFSGEVTVHVGTFNATPAASVIQPSCAVGTGSITVTSPSASGYGYSIGGAYQPSPVFSNLSPGNYTVSVQNGGGCVSSGTTTITIDPASGAPAAPGTVTGLVNVCQYIGSLTTVSYKVSPDPNASGYQWTLPPTLTMVSGQGTDSIAVLIGSGFIANANKVIKVKALSTCGNSSDKLFYLAAQLPSTPAVITATSTNICANLGTNIPVTFTIPKIASASSYIWTTQSITTSIAHPNGTGVNDTLVTVTFTNGFTNSNISVQAVNDCGTSSARSLAINRNNLTTPGLISGPTNVCPYISPNGIAAIYSIVPVANAVSYTWAVPAGVIGLTGQGSTLISFIYPPGFTGGTISVTATNGCGISPARTQAITTLNPATPGIIDVINTVPCPNRQYTYSIAAMPSNATSIVWTVPAGATIISGQGSISITVTYPNAAVNGSVTIQGSNNCKSGTTRSVTVKLAACAVSFAGKNNISNKVNSTKEEIVIDGMNINISPNPFVNDFKLQVIAAGKEQINVRMMDVQGRMFKQFHLMPYQTVKIGTELKAGIYMVEVRQGEHVKIRRVIKF